MPDIAVPVGSIVATGLAPAYVRTTTNITSTSAITLPMFVVESAVDTGIALPMFTMEATGLTGEITNEFQVPLELPVFEVSSTILRGDNATSEFDLPQFVVSAASGDSAEITLPQFDVTSSALVGFSVAGDFTLPQFTVAVQARGDNAVEITLPQFVVASDVLVGALDTSSFVLPQFTVAATSVQGVVATSAITLPMFTVNAVVHGEYVINALFDLPMLLVSSDGYSAFAETYKTWAMNTVNNGVTEYNSFVFNSFAKIGDRYFAASSTGIYELTGDDDTGTDIAASVTFRNDNFGDSRMARIPAVYIAAEATDNLRLGVAASGNVYQYDVPETGTTDLVSRRVDTVRGEKAVYWQLSVSNVSGADFRLHTVEPLVKKMTRRV